MKQKMITPLALIFASMLYLAFASPSNVRTLMPSVINGETMDPFTNSFVGPVMSFTKDSLAFVCTATMLTDRVAITSSVCTIFFKRADFIKMVITKPDKTMYTIPVLDYVRCSYYDSIKYNCNFAFLILAKGAKAQHVKVAKKRVPVKSQVELYSYAYENDGGDTLSRLNMTLVDKKICKDFFSPRFPSFGYDEILCAEPLQGITCGNDFGAPLFQTNGKELELISVFTLTRDCKTNGPAIFSDLLSEDAQKFLQSYESRKDLPKSIHLQS